MGGDGDEAPHGAGPARQRNFRMVSGFIGGVAVGLGVNAVSDSFPGVLVPAIAVSAFLIVVAADTLRQLSPRAPVHRLVARASLSIAAVTIVAATLLALTRASPELTSWTVLLSATFGVMACLRPGSVQKTFDQLYSVGLIGFGVASIGFGAGRFLTSVQRGVGADLAIGAAIVIAGIGAVIFGAGILIGNWLDGAGAILAGIGFLGYGVAPFLGARYALGILGGVLGLGLIGLGLSLLRGRGRFIILLVMMVGIAGLGMGIDQILDMRLLSGVSGTCIGVGSIGASVGLFLDRPNIAIAAILFAATGLAGVGVAFLRDGQILLGIAATGAGIALIGSFVAFSDLSGRATRWLSLQLREPD